MRGRSSAIFLEILQDVRLFRFSRRLGRVAYSKELMKSIGMAAEVIFIPEPSRIKNGSRLFLTGLHVEMASDASVQGKAAPRLILGMAQATGRLT